MISEIELTLEEEGAKIFRVGTIEGVRFPNLPGRLDLTRSLIALAIIVTLMGWGFPVAGMALRAELGPADGLADRLGLAEGGGGLAKGSGVD